MRNLQHAFCIGRARKRAHSYIIFESMEDAREFSPLVAYPISYVDPAANVDAETRDDGETLLRRLHWVWQELVSEVGSRDAFAALVLGASNVISARVASLFDGLETPNSFRRPKVMLVRPNTFVLSPETIDKCQTDERKQQMVAIHGKRGSAVLNWESDTSPRPKIIVSVDARDFPGMTTTKPAAEIELSPGSSEDDLDVYIVSFTGTRKTFKVRMGAGSDAISTSKRPKRLPVSVFDARFLLDNERELRSLLAPTLPNQLPLDFCARVAEFWKYGLRADALVAACQPASNLSARSICVSSASIVAVGKDASSQRMLLRATLHASSSDCVCAAHGLQPMSKKFSKRKFVSSQVTMSISMCGRRLHRHPGSKIGMCPLHQSSTPIIGSITDVCCHGTSCEVVCAHYTEKKEFVPGLSVRNIPLDDANLLHAQTLVAAAMRCSACISPLIGKRKRDEIADECDRQCDRADAAIAKAKAIIKSKGLGTEHDEDVLAEMDKRAAKLLRAHKVGQQWKSSQKRTILAVAKADPGTYSAVEPKDRCLNELHRWMFPRL